MTRKNTIIGLGTAALGRPQYINIREEARDAEETLEMFKVAGSQLLESAYQQGIRYFDTAPGYGMAEQLIHEWLEEEHRQLELATKWGYRYVANFDPNATVHEVKDHSLSLLNEQWGNSQRLLPMTTTLQIHSATFESGVLKNEAVLDRLAEIKATAPVKIGLTTTGNNQVEVLKAALDVHRRGSQLFEVFQVTYNVMDQSLEVLSADLAGKRVVIKEALANGRVFRNGGFRHYYRLYDELERLARRHEVGVDAVALRFCIDALSPEVVLSGASTEKQLGENLKAMSFSLSDDELEELKSFRVPAKEYWEERKLLAWN